MNDDLSPDRLDRRRDAALAGHRGDVDAARSFCNDTDPVVRATALRALARAGALAPDVVTEASRDAHPVVRRSSAELIAGATAPELDRALVALLADPEAEVIEAAAWAAGERERPTAAVVDALVRLTTTHTDALVREAAVAALGAIGDERALPAILDATRDKATVRRRAVIALAPFDGAEVDAALARAATDRDWQVRQAAEDLRD